MNVQPVLFNVEGHIATVTLNRPGKANAFEGKMWLALEEAVKNIETDQSIKAVVLTGAGKSFCGGLDINQAMTEGLDLGDRAVRGGYETLHYLSEVFSRYARLPVPVLASIRGGCIGLGLELALACDIRLASEDAVFSIPEVAFGLVPDCGGTQRLPRLVGPALAKELIYTARRIDSSEALRIGLINRVCPAEELAGAVQQMAAEIAGHPPEAVQASKRCIDFAMNSSMEAGLQFETSASESVLGEKLKDIINRNRHN